MPFCVNSSKKDQNVPQVNWAVFPGEDILLLKVSALALVSQCSAMRKLAYCSSKMLLEKWVFVYE